MENSITSSENQNTYNHIDLKDGKYTGSYLIAENDRYQSVYSSQNYGCFYEIYVKADFVEEKDTDSLVNQLEFRIINYKGLLNVGFANITQQKDELYFNEKEGVLGVRFVLQGKQSNNSMLVKIPREWNLRKTNLNRLSIFRLLIPLEGLELKTTAPQEMFDVEFYERNGLDFSRKKIVQPGHYDFDKPRSFGPDIKEIAELNFFQDLLSKTDEINNIEILAKDSNCYTSTMYVK